MWIFKVIIQIVIAFCSGLIAAAGVSALITTVGIITRLSCRTNTIKNIGLYENILFVGVVASIFFYLIEPKFNLPVLMGQILIAIIGFFMGCFVGCLALSLAEALDVSTIYFRRIKMGVDVKYIILSVALGKFLGNILYFVK